MSLIKANAVQVGQSPTATQNFTLAVPSSPDGTIKLARGNSGATTQDVLSVDANGNINGLVKATGSTTARSLVNRFADVVNVLDFGADPTGAVDSRQAIEDALNTGKTIIFPKGEYTCSSGIEITSKNVQIIGNGSKLNFTTGYLAFKGVIDSTQYTLASAPSYGSNIFLVTGGSFVSGSVMQLIDTTDFSFSLHRSYYRKGQLFNVRSVIGNTITTDENSVALWSTGANISVKKITPVEITIRDLEVVSTGTHSCQLEYTKNSYIENSKFIGGILDSLSIRNSIGCTIKSCECYCTNADTGYQYGIVIDDSQSVLIDNCDCYGTRHGISLGGHGDTGTKFVTIQNSKIQNNQTTNLFSADVHGNCSQVTYQNNQIHGGAGMAGEYVNYINNKIYLYTSTSPAIFLNEIVGGNFIIDKNFIDMGSSTSNKVIGSGNLNFLGKINYSYHTQITNNEIFVNINQWQIVFVGTHNDRPLVQPSITMENNTFRGTCSSLLGIIVQSSMATGSPLTYTATTGPFVVKDLSLHPSMLSSISVFYLVSGTIATGARFIFPEINIAASAQILNGASTATTSITYPFSFGLVPPVQATLSNANTSQNGKYVFAGVDSSLPSSCTGVFTTGNTASTLTANTTFTANFKIGGAYTRP
jgi:hypothetical protein